MEYSESGVDLGRAAGLAGLFRLAAQRTDTAMIQADPGGGFCALHRLPGTELLLASAADGIGSKGLLLAGRGLHQTAGYDLVAMNVNDLATCGAAPLFFHDYIAMERLERATVAALLAGMEEGCLESGCALTGGESAEMPGAVPGNGYELAGFACGTVEPGRLLSRERVQCGDLLFGLHSDGVHANGFSLIRQILSRQGTDPAAVAVGGRSLQEALLQRTRIYVQAVKGAMSCCGEALHAAAHITGGGLPENLARILPSGCDAQLEQGAWPVPPVFDWISQAGEVAAVEMLRVFNMGLGMVFAVAPHAAAELSSHLDGLGFPHTVAGRVVPGSGRVCFV